jgi:hypothetical protein
MKGVVSLYIQRYLNNGRLVKFISGVFIPLCVLAFVISTRVGFWGYWFGLNHVEKVAANLETSYATNVSRQVRPGDPAWKPLLRLINKYSTANFPKDREPKVFARYVAVGSHKIEAGNELVAEWTAPTTPIMLIYKEWPGQKVERKDNHIVGSIADLRTWITRSKDDFRFLVQDVALAVLSLVFAVVLWINDRS